MPSYDCRPNGGTNSAPDSFNDTHTFDDFTFDVAKFDILVEANDAVVAFKPAAETAWGDEQLLPLGGPHSITTGNLFQGIRIKNRNSGSAADYQLTAFPP